MSTPSKDQLKEKYGITNPDFRVLTNLPPEREIRTKGFLFKAGEAFGAEEWMWKTWTGVLIAIIIVAPQIQSTLDYWRPKIVYSVSQFSDYFRHLQWPLTPSDDEWIAFVPDSTPAPRRPQAPQSLPVGSSLFPSPARSPTTVPNQFVAQVRYHFRERFLDAAPGEKQVSAPATFREMLPLSEVMAFERGLGRVIDGSVSHLPYHFRVTVLDPEITVEAYRDNQTIEGFPQTIRHPLTSHWDSRTDVVIPIDDALKDQLETTLLGEHCFLTYVNLVIGADDDLVESAILRSRNRA